jgi:hypothetical protein
VFAVVLKTQGNRSETNETAIAAHSRKGKKRARGYEGDEVLGARVTALCSNDIHAQVLLTSVDGAFLFYNLLIIVLTCTSSCTSAR